MIATGALIIGLLLLYALLSRGADKMTCRANIGPEQMAVPGDYVPCMNMKPCPIHGNRP